MIHFNNIDENDLWEKARSVRHTFLVENLNTTKRLCDKNRPSLAWYFRTKIVNNLRTALNLEIDERKNQAPSRVRDTERWSSFFCSTKTTTSLRRRSFLFRSRQAQLHGSSVERMSNPRNNLITHFANQEVLNETLGSRIFASSVTTKTETVLKRRKTRNGEEPSDIHVSRSVEYGYSKTTKR